MTDQEKVLAKYPDAYVRTWGRHYQIVRPRKEEDKKSLAGVNFVSLSSPHSEESIAWWYAARNLDGYR